jgi:hypothetical protein
LGFCSTTRTAPAGILPELRKSILNENLTKSGRSNGQVFQSLWLWEDSPAPHHPRELFHCFNNFSWTHSLEREREEQSGWLGVCEKGWLGERESARQFLGLHVCDYEGVCIAEVSASGESISSSWNQWNKQTTLRISPLSRIEKRLCVCVCVYARAHSSQ